ncbi:ArsI/CadI family heavy metal resistance metalloenzyme [Streptomyces cucumeris]|uniref:ArsI/CadI family heavy metal resistance metalloenzyme n=1 Tax=Streptomyces cucumeris TaxID=2962890 RepID=UPI0020C87F91|nr:ArsI/CadI family heavy metal resistance metalloenzyme [Streptomyces sp. NEAU-Y11]MCP9212379.1 VOC family protein [Streptomyces sp. NEAU-Y11]
MSRVQLALNVPDLDASVAFYSKLFGAEPAKRRPGYANFAITEPPLKLVLIEGEAGQDTRLDHLGVEVASTDQVNAAADRLKGAGLATFEENDTSCCYALQDKVWVHGPGKEPWEVYVVKADADNLGKGVAVPGAADTCCTDRPGAEEAAAASGCGCGA